jgi:hypothetical protein
MGEGTEAHPTQYWNVYANAEEEIARERGVEREREG